MWEKLNFKVGDVITSVDLKDIKNYAVTLHPVEIDENGFITGTVYEIDKITSDMTPYYKLHGEKHYFDKSDCPKDYYHTPYVVYKDKLGQHTQE